MVYPEHVEGVDKAYLLSRIDAALSAIERYYVAKYKPKWCPAYFFKLWFRVNIWRIQRSDL